MSDNGRRRVVVTGVGALTPLGSDAESVLAGDRRRQERRRRRSRSSIPASIRSRSGARSSDFDPTDWIDVKSSRKMDRFTQMVLAAAIQAQRDSGIDVAADAERIGASIATGIGGLKSFQDCHKVLIDKGPDRVGPFSIPSLLPNMGAGWVSIVLGTRGPALLGVHGLRRLEHGDRHRARPDPARPRGRDVRGRGRVRYRAGRHRRLQRDARAVAAQRRPGAGEPAVRRRARRFRHGRGSRGARAGRARAGEEARRQDLRRSSSATGSRRTRSTSPSPIRAATTRPARCTWPWSDAGVGPEDIDYVNAHGTSTPIGDASETRVIKVALGEEKAKSDARLVDEGRHRALSRRLRRDRRRSSRSSPASVTSVPPTINYEYPDPECDLDYIPNEARETPVEHRAVEQLRVRRPQRLPGLQEVPRVATAGGERWATFDVYGTLIDWDGGIGGRSSGCGRAGRRRRCSGAYHEVEPERRARAAQRVVPGGDWPAACAAVAERGEASARAADEDALADALRRLAAVSRGYRRPRRAALAAAGGWRRSRTPIRTFWTASLGHLGVAVDERVVASEIGSYKPAHGHWQEFFREPAPTARDTSTWRRASFHDIAPANELGLASVWINRLGETPARSRRESFPTSASYRTRSTSSSRERASRLSSSPTTSVRGRGGGRADPGRIARRGHELETAERDVVADWDMIDCEPRRVACRGRSRTGDCGLRLRPAPPAGAAGRRLLRTSRAHGPRCRPDARPVDGAAGPRARRRRPGRRARSALQRRPGAQRCGRRPARVGGLPGRPPVSRDGGGSPRAACRAAQAGRSDHSPRRARPRRARLLRGDPGVCTETTGTRSRRTSRRGGGSMWSRRRPIRRSGSWLTPEESSPASSIVRGRPWARGTCAGSASVPTGGAAGSASRFCCAHSHEFYERGERTVFLDVDTESPTGATRLYERAGMRKGWTAVIFEKELRAGRPVAGPAG